MVAIPLDALPPLRVEPKHDRSSTQRKVRWLAEHGFWRGLEAVKNAHGWHSQTVLAWMDSYLPVTWCHHCGNAYYGFSKRLKYCSDRCRRNAAAHREYHHEILPAVPVEHLTRYAIRLVRATGTYQLALLPELLGEATLTLRWRHHHSGEQQRTQRYPDLASAAAAFVRYRDAAIGRGYREEVG